MGSDMLRQLFAQPGESAQMPMRSETPADRGDDAGTIERGDAPQSGSIYHQQNRPFEEERGEGRGGLWQVHNKYILSQLRSGLMIIDQHVAHERILYEQALRSMEAAMPMSQQLLFPLEMKITPTEHALLREIRSDLTALGFEISLERGEKLTIHGVPNDVRTGQEGAILRELLDQFEEYQRMGMTGQRDMLAASFACRASIKAGDPLTEPEMLNLIEQLFSTSMPYVCPHGRPIVIRIDLAELDRRFGRTS
jgi:DNA mismatch repair protein MutL